MTETNPDKKNIFSSPLSKMAQQKKEEALAAQKKNRIKAGVLFAVSFLVLGVYSVNFFYPQLNEYLHYEEKISEKLKEVKDHESALSDLKGVRDEKEAEYNNKYMEQQNILAKVLPEDSDKLGVIRLMEEYAAYLNATYGDFEFTQLSFSQEEERDGLTMLPFATTIHATTQNFGRFLDLVNKSGDTNPESEQIRLMEISNISLRYLGPDNEGKDQGVDFQVRMVAFSQ
jgi:hypothetical protein